MIGAFVSLLALLFLFQGIPSQQGGTVTGVLRDAEGRPVPGVRMAAVAQLDSIEEAAGGAAMAGIAETDEVGRYTLENVPPGRYYIAAGRLDLQTYFPGTQTTAEATAVTITPGATLSGMDFVLNNTSFGRAPSFFTPGGIAASIPLQIKVEHGGKLPVSANGNFTLVRLEAPGTILNNPLQNGVFSISGPRSTDFQVTVQNLPDTYAVKSITYGSTDITQGTFRLTPANFPATGPVATPPSVLTVTLINVAIPDAGGIRVSGRIGTSRRRLIYVSGTPGVLFSDGTFEFRGVPPGRHRIAAANSTDLPMAAIVVVGDRNVEGIELKDVPLLPADILTSSEPLPAREYKPGSTLPLTQVTGTVLEERTREPISEGSVIINAGNYSRSTPIDSTGHFEAFSLLPGTYDLKLQIFGHSSSSRTIEVDDKDMNLELTSLRLY